MKSFVFPGNIEESILKIGGQPFPYMRTSEFSALVKESEDMLLSLIGCSRGRVIFYTASGTGAMDAVVCNYVSQFKKAFVVAGGSFGYRWKQICDYYQCACDTFEVAFAKDINYEELEKAVMASKPDVFLCQHHETSTGQLYDLKKISMICKKNGVSLVVDVISSFLADPLNMDELGIDICITSSQKGLNIAPGLSFVILSEHLSNQNFANKSYYFDFAENLKNLERGQTPYSPATTIFLQLHARLLNNVKIGANNIIASVRERAMFFRKLCKENGWEMPVEVPSNCITGFFVRRNGERLFKELIRKDIYIMPGGTPNYFRVSHLGIQSEDDLIDLAECIKTIENL